MSNIIITIKSYSAPGRVCGLLAVVFCLAPGCAHHRIPLAGLGRLGAMPGLEPPAPLIPFWLLAVLAALALTGLVFRRRLKRARGCGPALSVDREDLALLRTARDALRLLFKKKLRGLKLVPLDLFRGG